MFCPKCGQQQSSDGVRFCSRCGFQLEVVKELLVTDGALVLPEAEIQRDHRSPRNRGIRQGVMLMLLTALLVPVTALLAKLGILPKEIVALAAIICAIGGFMRLVYALMFEESARTKKRTARDAGASSPPQQLRTGAAARSLPPQQGRPASDFYSGRRTETAEIAHQQPPSVTENTTRLLDNTNDD
jgi:hypothetical protein